MGRKGIDAKKAVERAKKSNAWHTEYSRQNYRVFAAKLQNESDADVIAWLEAQPNKTRAIAELVRAQIAREQGEGE